MSNTSEKVRSYQPEYLKYGFVEQSGDISRPQCILCDKVLSNESMRPSKLKYHLENVHKEHKDKDEAFLENAETKRRTKPK